MLKNWVSSKFGSFRGQAPVVDDSDRRRATRYPARNPNALLGWSEGREPAFAPLKIVNISRSGMLFVADVFLPTGFPIKVRFEDQNDTWIEGRVVHVRTATKGPNWVRVSFEQSCPDDLLNSVIEDRQDRPASTAQAGVESALVLLGLQWPCQPSDVKAAFRVLSKRHHPDLGGTTEGFLALRRATDLLIQACGVSPDLADEQVSSPVMNRRPSFAHA